MWVINLFYQKMKQNHKCSECGSEFDLIKQHYTHTHLNHREKLKLKTPSKIICRTCEYFEDFWKNFYCYHKALEKALNKKMEKMGL
mgnify:CR=1 FL=1